MEQSVLMRTMSLSLYRIPDGQHKGQSKVPCPSVYAPTSALGSLSSVALSSAPANKTLSRSLTVRAKHPHISQTISNTFLFEATNLSSSTFLREAIGVLALLRIPRHYPPAFTASELMIMIFCHIFRERPVVKSSTSLTAARATGSSNFCTYKAASFPMRDNISLQ